MPKAKANGDAPAKGEENPSPAQRTAEEGNVPGTQSGTDEAPPSEKPGGSGTGDSDVRSALDRATEAIAKLDAWEGDKAGLIKRIDDANTALDTYRQELETWKAGLSAREKKEQETAEQIATLQTELASLRQALTEAQESLKTLTTSKSPTPQSTPSSPTKTAGELAKQATETPVSSPGSPQTPDPAPEGGGGPAPKSNETKAGRKYRIV